MTAIDSTETHDIEVCDDCAMLVANGEVPEGLPEFELLPEWDDFHLALDCDDDGCEGFTWTPCDGCGSRLGGTRHNAVAMKVSA